MDPSFPVFVGVTGKRNLEGHQSDVSRCLNEIFDDLDERLPDTPKVLVTGAAAGADLLAVQTLFARPNRNWLVLAVLPFARDHFEKDFADDPAALDLLRQTLADKRTRTHELPMLCLANETEASSEHIDSKTEDLSPALLKERAVFRRQHYEQVGMWIAQTVNILIAVMPAEETPAKVGGTARVVDFRLNGRPFDDAGRDIAAASTAIAHPSELKRVVGGFVWLVDPWQPRDGRKGRLPIKVWQPGDINASLEAAPEHRRVVGSIKDSVRIVDLAASYASRRVKRSVGNTLSAWPSERDPAIVLKDISAWTATTANAAASKVRWAFYILAVLFLLAISAFEFFAKFLPKNPYALGGYVLVFGCILALYVCVRVSRWQPFAEDTRAIREALRVQRAWWQAGLLERVDRHHLQDAHGDLIHIREAIANVIWWSLIACRNQPPVVSWPDVFQSPAGRSPVDWVNNQANWFEQRYGQRKHRGHIFDALSWMLFVTSGFLACALLIGLAGHYLHEGVPSVPALLLPYSGHSMLLLVVIVYFLFWCATLHMHAFPSWLRGMVSIFSCLVTACLLATGIIMSVQFALGSHAHLLPWVAGSGVCLTALLIFLGLKDANSTNPHAVSGAITVFLFAITLFATFLGYRAGFEGAQTAKYSAVIVIVLLPAIAGTMRFIAEKLAFEAEELSYRDAFGWFSRAARILAKERDKKIVFELGLLALQEQEAWLKARRQRPLTPVIGG